MGENQTSKNEVKKVRYEFFIAIVTLIASTVAIGASVYSNYISKENSNEIAHIKSIYDIADSIGAEFSIDYPTDNQRIKEANFSIGGTWSGEINVLQQNNLWVFAKYKEGTVYFPALGAVTTTANNDWVSDVYLGIYGKFRLLVVLVDSRESEWLQRWFAETSGKGFETLPKNAVILEKVEIERIKKVENESIEKDMK